MLPTVGKFLTIGITAETPVVGEATRIVQLLDSCLDYVHLRRPAAVEQEMRTMIESLPARLYGRLKLHSHFNLAEEYGLGGIHLNSRSTECRGCRGTVSRSCHSIEETIELAPGYEYVTLSPVYDSISKSGYHSRISLQGSNIQKLPTNVIALGGVTPARFRELAKVGFAGAAMLGYLWQPGEDALSRVIELISKERRYLCCNL